MSDHDFPHLFPGTKLDFGRRGPTFIRAVRYKDASNRPGFGFVNVLLAVDRIREVELDRPPVLKGHVWITAETGGREYMVKGEEIMALLDIVGEEKRVVVPTGEMPVDPVLHERVRAAPKAHFPEWVDGRPSALEIVASRRQFESPDYTEKRLIRERQERAQYGGTLTDHTAQVQTAQEREEWRKMPALMPAEVILLRLIGSPLGYAPTLQDKEVLESVMRTGLAYADAESYGPKLSQKGKRWLELDHANTRRREEAEAEERALKDEAPLVPPHVDETLLDPSEDHRLDDRIERPTQAVGNAELDAGAPNHFDPNKRGFSPR